MNRALLSPKMLAGTAISATALLLLMWSFAGRPDLREVCWALWVGALSVVVHEKIARCESPFLERALRFSGFVLCLFFVPAMILMSTPVAGTVIVRSLLSALAVGTITVGVCYRLDPVGPGRYFSVSARFNDR